MGFRNIFVWEKLWPYVVIVFCFFFISDNGYCNIELNDSLPAPLISIEPNKNNIIIVEKFSQQLFLYEYDGEYRKVESMTCSTGKVSGNKFESGDKISL